MIIIFYTFFYSIISKSTVSKVAASLSIIDKGMLPLEMKSVGIQFYLDVENKERLSSCKVQSRAQRCCYIDSEIKGCNEIPVYGANMHILKPKDREIFLFVYPALIQENLVGSCGFALDYRCGNIKKFKREETSIPFDTRFKKSDNILNYFHKSATCASIDQDVLNNCEAVNCDLKYIGIMPFYNDKVNKCVPTPICNGDPLQELPDVIYDPRSNTCKDLENPLTIADVYAITSGLGLVIEPTNFDGATVKLQSNCNTISENINFLKDMMYGKLYPPYQGSVPDFSVACDSAILSIILSVLLLSSVVLGLVCCLSSSLWIFKNISRGDLTNYWANIKSKLKNRNFPKCRSNKTKVNRDIKNKLLRDVIVSDLPMELRGSIENICERINREVKWKKRYRREDLGSRINLVEASRMTSATSSPTTPRDDEDQ